MIAFQEKHRFFLEYLQTLCLVADEIRADEKKFKIISDYYNSVKTEMYLHLGKGYEVRGIYDTPDLHLEEIERCRDCVFDLITALFQEGVHRDHPRFVAARADRAKYMSAVSAFETANADALNAICIANLAANLAADDEF